MPITDPDDATLALTRELIARQSVTPDDAGCQDAMVSRLKQAGFSVDAMRFGEVDNFGQRMAHRGRCWRLQGTLTSCPPVTKPAGIRTHLKPR